MTPDTETTVALKGRPPGSALQGAQARWLRFRRPALVFAACALLAAGGTYACASVGTNPTCTLSTLTPAHALQ